MLDSDETQKIPISLTREFIETCRKETDPGTWKTKMRNTVTKTCNNMTQVLRHMLPVVHVIRNYKVRSFLVNDVIGILTVTFMQLPQGMAYAIVADLPIEVGIFMGFFPVICYFILGTSRHLSFDRVISVLKASGAFKTLQHVMYPTTYDAMLATSYEEDEINTRL